MEYCFAPLEGLTDSIYRRLHHACFPGVDRYYMPFLSPTMHHSLTAREKRDLPPADSVPFTAIPQILTKVPEDFLWAANVCGEQGYREVNLNVGCPSGTVTAKGKGAGMLAEPEKLDAFLGAVFSGCPLKISVKTRLGITNPDEFVRILEVFNQYPICLLIIHPRVRKDFYHDPIHMDTFTWALEHTKLPVCYNGNLCSLEDIAGFRKRFPQVEQLMLGRGLIGDPGMLSPGGTDRASLIRFHDALMEEYLDVFGSTRNAMFRMKENWRYLLCRFEGVEKLSKKLRKTTNYDEYMSITGEILSSLPMKPRLEPDW